MCKFGSETNLQQIQRTSTFSVLIRKLRSRIYLLTAAFVSVVSALITRRDPVSMCGVFIDLMGQLY